MASLIVLLLFILQSQSSTLSLAAQSDHDFSYMKFVHNSTDSSLEGEYDYIIVGGGTAGCSLAATLSTNHSVLVLERGGTPQENPSVLSSSGIITNLLKLSTHDSPAQGFVSEDGIPNARGRILGGSSMINAGFYSRAEEEFYQSSGIEWDRNTVEEAYQWVEESVASVPNLGAWQSAVRDAMLESGLGPYHGFSLEHIKGTKIGGSTFDALGRRHGAVELLNKAEPENIRVAIRATVERIIFSNSNSSRLSAIGVVYVDSKGRSHRAMVKNKGEVILSAGTLGSPQLLLLSGIGPSSYLSSLQIDVNLHQPNVGQFLHDVPQNYILISPPFPVESSAVQVAAIGDDFYIETISFNLPFYFPTRSGLFSKASSPNNLSVPYILQKIARTHSDGSLKLASPWSAKVNPIVRFNYFEDPRDLAQCVHGLRELGKITGTTSIRRFETRDLEGVGHLRFFGPPIPSNLSDNAAMESHCRRTMTTIWHYHGGCRVGKVVDGAFRVMGIDALRIVDMSIMNTSPGTNPQATIMMMGRYAGLKIMKQRMELGNEMWNGIQQGDGLYNEMRYM